MNRGERKAMLLQAHVNQEKRDHLGSIVEIKVKIPNDSQDDESMGELVFLAVVQE